MWGRIQGRSKEEKQHTVGNRGEGSCGRGTKRKVRISLIGSKLLPIGELYHGADLISHGRKFLVEIQSDDWFLVMLTQLGWFIR